jgi:hypothetical protein
MDETPDDAPPDLSSEEHPLSTQYSALGTPSLRERLLAYGATPAPGAPTWADALVAAVWEAACRGQAPLVKVLLDADAAGPGPTAWLDEVLRRMDAEEGRVNSEQ